jgi:hypothetical protein
MQHSWTKNGFWDVNNKKWRKWCKLLLIPYLITLRAYLCHNGNQLSKSIFLCLIARSTDYLFQIGAGKVTHSKWWYSYCLLDMHRSWTKNAFGNLKCKKWLKWCILFLPILFKFCFGLPVPTMGTKCPNHVFYAWLYDLQNICA